MIQPRSHPPDGIYTRVWALCTACVPGRTWERVPQIDRDTILERVLLELDPDDRAAWEARYQLGDLRSPRVVLPISRTKVLDWASFGWDE